MLFLRQWEGQEMQEQALDSGRPRFRRCLHTELGSCGPITGCLMQKMGYQHPPQECYGLIAGISSITVSGLPWRRGWESPQGLRAQEPGLRGRKKEHHPGSGSQEPSLCQMPSSARGWDVLSPRPAGHSLMVGLGYPESSLAKMCSLHSPTPSPRYVLAR